jgi:hypothetical protein
VAVDTLAVLSSALESTDEECGLLGTDVQATCASDLCTNLCIVLVVGLGELIGVSATKQRMPMIPALTLPECSDNLCASVGVAQREALRSHRLSGFKLQQLAVNAPLVDLTPFVSSGSLVHN